MNIGELFVNLGITGADKTTKEIAGVQKGMSGLYDTSLEAKVAVVGAMYALERLFATSGAAGTNLTNFNATLGVSAQTLQKYQGAAREVGVSNQAVEASFRSLQSAATKTLLGKGAPEGLARVASITGGITTRDLEEYQKAPELFLQKLQQYAQKEGNAGLRNEILKSFVGEDMAAALTRDAFNAKSLARAPTYSDHEIAALDQANIAWSKLGTHIQIAVGQFNARHGGQLVTDISRITDAVLRLADALDSLAEKLHFFQALGHLLDGIANFVKVVNADLNVATGDSAKNQKDPLMKQAGAGLEQFNATIGNGDWWIDLINQGLTSAHDKATAVHNNNYSVNQNLNFSHDGKNAGHVAGDTGRAVNNALRQMPSQKQVN